MIHTGLVTREAELDEILALQRANLEPGLPAAEVESQGFVTVAHTRDALLRMHALAPSVIARDGATLAGYALVMPAETRAFVPVLGPMFDRLDALAFSGTPLRALRWYVMGQVCVAKAYRGSGVFDALYRQHRASYGSRFDLCVTEVAMRNTRSLRAHERVGFEIVDRYRDETDDWAVIAFPLGSAQP